MYRTQSCTNTLHHSFSEVSVLLRDHYLTQQIDNTWCTFSKKGECAAVLKIIV